VKLNNLIFSAIYNFTPSSLQLAMVQGLIIKHKAITLIIFWACPSIKMEGRTFHSYLFIFTAVSVANKKDPEASGPLQLLTQTSPKTLSKQ
jgi:hypothetical protein